MSQEKGRRVIYGLEDRPPFPQNVVLAAQHVLTMLGATVSVPLLFGPMMGMSPEQIATLVSSVMICSGCATLLQVTIGSRLPIIQGVSFSFLAAFIGIVASSKEMAAQTGQDAGPLAMQYIAGAVILGALVEVVVGFSGLVGRLRRFLSPVVIGPVIMLVGLALFKHGAPKAGTCWPISGLTIGCVILFSLVLSKRSRFFRLFPILLAILVAYGAAVIGTAAGWFPAGHPAHVDLSTVAGAQWVRVNPAEIVFPWGMPKFHLGFFFAVLAGYLASMIESFGDYHAAAAMSGAPDPSPKQLSRGIGSEGLGCMLTGLLGGFSSTSYSENIGLVGITKVASLHVVKIGALFLIGFGIFGKFGAFIASIPGPVVGGLYCALFGLIAAVGIQQLSKADLTSDRNLFIAGFALFMGLSLPAYFEGSVLINYATAPGEPTQLLYSPGAATLLEGLPDWASQILTSIGTAGMAIAALVGLLLDNLIPGSDEERGLV